MDAILQDLLTALAILITALVFAWLFGLVLSRYVRRLLLRTRTNLDNLVVEAVQSPLRLAIIVIGLDIATQRVAAIGESARAVAVELFFFCYLVLATLIVYRLSAVGLNWYSKAIAKKTESKADDKFLAFFRYTAGILIAGIALIIILGRFNINVSALITTLGIGSLAIALAAQATLSDIIAGFMLVIDQPFKLGDRIEILDIDTWGDVVDIGLRSTRILTRDNRTVAIPNSVIGKGLVVNYSLPSTRFRVETHVGIAYGSDIEAVRTVMVETIRAQDWVMKEERIEALLLEFGDSALIFRVRCWIQHYVETRRIIDQMNSALYHALREAGHVIPVPQRDVHLISRVTAVPDPT